VLGGQAVTGRELVVDGLGHRPVLDGGHRRDDVRDQVRGVRLTGLGEVDFVAVPHGVVFHAAACVGVIGGDQAQRARRAVFWAPASHLAVHVLEVLDPHLPQGLHLGKPARPGGGIGAEECRQQTRPVPPDPFSYLVALPQSRLDTVAVPDRLGALASGAVDVTCGCQNGATTCAR
jgi:hypothetical protein